MGKKPTAVIKPSLKETFKDGWEACRIIMFSAPCGCGKTTAAYALLRGKKICVRNAADSGFLSERIPDNFEAVLIDDMQFLREQERQQALCELIKSRPDLHFILLGRNHIPGWLMPFQFAGMMLTIETADLLFDRETSRHMLETRGISVTPIEMSKIQSDFNGYPLTLELLCRHLEQGADYNTDVFNECKRELFLFYDDAVLHLFDMPLRRLLICLAPFDSFHLEFAKIISGEPAAGEMLGVIQRETTMLLFDGMDTYHFRPVFKEFLKWKYDQIMTDAEQKAVYSRAALYFELHGELEKALDCYSRSGEHGKISALLIKNAEKNPGAGHYREMQDYYFSLPQSDILRSPSLICGMSMLTAMCLDYDASEQWYRELENYASRLNKNDPEYREVYGRLAYLDISLPQRGCKNLIEVIKNVFHVMKDKNINVPSFSVTSNLPSIMNGGKDFCEWSKKDNLLYATMRAPVEAVLGKDGVGLADCAICESKFEKGANVSEQMLTLMGKLCEIQTRGTPDIEFAVMGLLARIYVSQGKALTALESISSLRTKYEDTGEARFMGNIDALICRLQLLTGDRESALRWLENTSPKNDARLWAMWRYQYITRAMVQISEGDNIEPLLLLARLEPYCEKCGRVMDGLYITILSALCLEQQNKSIWKKKMRRALDISFEYQFIRPVAQFGAAVLPLVRSCGWRKDMPFLDKIIDASQQQAVLYPHFLMPAPIPEQLSSAEMQVLCLLCQNLSNQEIGDILNIKLATVKSHVSHILQKLGVKNRGGAKDAAERLRLL